MKKLIIGLFAVASMILVPSVVLAKDKPATKAPVGYEGTPAKCWPNGSAYYTRACCVARGLARGQLRSGIERWCLRNGFTQ
jgi:hypothetical protein